MFFYDQMCYGINLRMFDDMHAECQQDDDKFIFRAKSVLLLNLSFDFEQVRSMY